MNATKILAIAAVAVAASFGAQADEADASQYVVQFHGVKTRAQVQAELKAPGVDTFDIAYNPVTNFKSGQTRAQVTAAYIADRDQVAALTSEDSGSAFLTAHAGQRAGGNALAGE